MTTGLIAHAYAGPAVALSWLVGGFVCAISGLSYAEMSARIPSAGSTCELGYGRCVRVWTVAVWLLFQW